MVFTHHRYRKPRRPRKTSTLAKWVSFRTGIVFSACSHEFIQRTGCKVKNWSRAKIEHRVRSYGFGMLKKGVPQTDVVNFEEGLTNLKVSASLSTVSGETFLYFDFDCHSRGKPSEIAKLYAILKKKIPELGPLFTNGRGGGAWLAVDFRDSPDDIDDRPEITCPHQRRWNALVERMHTWAKAELAASGLDIEAVEVRGKVIVVEHGMTVSTCPQLLKPPVSWEFVPAEVVAWRKLDRRDFTPVVVVKNKSVACGSTAFRMCLDGRAIPGIRGVAPSLNVLMPDRPVRTESGRRITDLQFAEILAVLVHVENQKDGTNPLAVHKAQIVAMNEAGILDYTWNFEAYQAVRNYLSDKGWIDWVDNRFMRSICDEHGAVLVKGYAMKWSLCEELCEKIEKSVPASQGYYPPASKPADGCVSIESEGQGREVYSSQIILPSHLTSLPSGSGLPLRPHRVFPTIPQMPDIASASQFFEEYPMLAW